MSYPSILLTTLGASWAVIPELLMWMDKGVDDFYKYHPNHAELDANREQYGFTNITELWIVTTNGTTEDLEKTRQWLDLLGARAPELRVFSFSRDDIHNTLDTRCFRELVFRSVLEARQKTRTGTLWLSLAGGRKTMSADVQAAATLFGCSGLLHVLDRSPREEQKNHPLPREPKDFLEPWPSEQIKRVLPIMSESNIPGNSLLDDLDPKEFPPGATIEKPPLLEVVENKLKESADLFANYRKELLDHEEGTNFLALYSLPSAVVETLKQTKFGTNPELASQELEWLKTLPKAELHCHLGGVLDAGGMIEVAGSLAERVDLFKDRWEPLFAPLKEPLRSGDSIAIRSWLEQHQGEHQSLWKLLRIIDGLPEPIGVCAFLLLFRHDPDLLDELIFGDLQDPERFTGYQHLQRKDGLSAFVRYEQLGDLQGSGLLQHESTIQATVGWWLNRCLKENVRYLELRCSPINYTRGGLSAESVVRIIREACEKVPEIETRLIFIGSRHGKSEELRDHIKLAEQLLEGPSSGNTNGSLAGFDLAGAEEKKEPSQLRNDFLPLLERCLSVTIHAGETEPARNIWEAVYHLQADRIGHGLTLKDNPELIPRFRDRRIGIELCPSSNMQIVGFKDTFLPSSSDQGVYPLKTYLEQGLRVTVNTDNPGISRTSPSMELHRAARMTPGGLSLWEILQLVRNSFRSSFADQQVRGRLIREAENSLMFILKQNSNTIRPPPDP